MRAAKPVRSGRVVRDGVGIAYEVHGEAGPALLFLPAWAISHSRLWKAQIATFARTHRVITYDPRGNGRSDRPDDLEAYATRELLGDALAVLDAEAVDEAVVVGNSFGSIIAYLLSALYPDRVQAAVHIGTTLNLDGETDAPLAKAIQDFEQPLSGDQGWQRYRMAYWQKDFPGFVEFFVQQAMSEPHSSKLVEDGVDWGLATTASALAHTVRARGKAPPDAQRAWLLGLAHKIRCRSLVLHGDADAISPVRWGRRLAETLQVDPVVWKGAGHCPQARHPARFNRLLAEFLADVTAPPTHDVVSAARSQRSSSRPPRALYLSSPIGLGHVRRDLAIADALRQRVPELEIDWLAQDPVTRFLEARGERIHPASRLLASESRHLELESGEHDLNVFEAFRRMDEILIANYMVFSEVVQHEKYDLVIGDEAWEVDHFLHEAPEQKCTRFAWLTDFVGYLPMPAGGERERWLAADYNAEMLEHVQRHPQVRDAAIFVGNPDDVVDLQFGDGLPSIRDWTQEHYAFAGYVTGFDPAALGSREDLRRSLGYEEHEIVVVSAVGGSGVGHSLLQRVTQAHHRLREQVSSARTVLVTGPRIDPASLPEVPGLDKRTFLPDLHRHLAACDLAVVQGGLSTTMELAACRRPFLYVPLQNHFEQQIHVRHRLERYRAGRAVDFAATDADALAEAMIEGLRWEVDSLPVETDGAERAAAMLAELL